MIMPGGGPRLFALRPGRDWQGQVHADAGNSGRIGNQVTELLASLLPVPGTALKPLGTDLHHQVHAGDVERAERSEPDLDIPRLKVMIVGLFWALDSDRNCMREGLRKLAQVVLRYPWTVIHLDNRHRITVPGERGKPWEEQC
jgi:hypothetical protein